MSGSNFFRKDSLYSHEKSAGAGMQIHVISSPEHEVLMVSYCGQSMSVVRRQQLL